MSDTAINPVTRRVQFTGNTGTGPFAFTFNILTDGDIAVYKNTTALTLTADYSVTINVNGTGSVTLVAALVSTDVLTIIGGRQLARTTDFVTAGDLLASSLNEQLDSNVIMAQQLDEKLGRGLYVNPGDVYTDLELPLKDARKGTVLGFNATTGDPEPGPEIGDVDSLAAISGDIKTLAEIQDGTVATDAITNVNTVRANVTTVAGISGNVTTVAGIASDVTAVAADATDIGTVAGQTTQIGLLGTADAVADMNTLAVAGIITDMDIIADNVSGIGVVAGDIGYVIAVAINASNINTVAADGTDIGTVATSIASVNTAATNIASINTNATNITDIQGASANAATATTQAGIASTQAGIATTKAGESAASASASATSATASEAAKDAALAALDNFDDRYLGAKASDPTLDNDGNALVAGALYYNTTDDVMKVYTGSVWVAAYASLAGALLTANNLSDLNNTSTARTNLGLGTAATSAATAFVAVTGDTMTGNLGVMGTVLADGLTVATATGSASPTPSEVSIGTNSSASDWSTTNPWGRLTFKSSDVSSSGPKDLVALDATAANTSGGVADFTVKTWSGSLLNRLKVSWDGDISFYEDTGTTAKFFWDASTERLGIGNAAPTTALDVTGTVTADGLTVETAQGDISIANSASSLNFARAGINYVRATDASGSFRFITGVDDFTNHRMSIASNGDIGFYEDTGATAKFFWDASAESLGLGTNAPKANAGLHIQGANGASGATTNVAANEFFIDNNGNTGMTLGSATTGTGYYAFADSNTALVGGLFYDHSTDDMGFRVTSATRMTIDSTGKVGIGTAAPASELEIASNADTRLRITDQRNGNVVVGDPKGGLDFYWSDSSSNFPAVSGSIEMQAADTYATRSAMVFKTNDNNFSATERMRIDNTGKVGIGNAAPATALDVTGTVTATSFSGGGIPTLFVESSGTATAPNSSDSVAIGGYAVSSGANSTALGRANAGGTDSFAAAIANASATYGAQGYGSISIGTLSKATQIAGTAVGYGATSTHQASSAFGTSATTTANNQIALGGSGITARISGAYTLPTADGTANQVLTTDGSGAVTFATAGGGGGADLYAANEVTPTAQPSATGTNAVAIGDTSVASGNNSFAIGSDTDATGLNSIALGKGAQAVSTRCIALGLNASASGDRSISIGNNGNVATAAYSTSIGSSSAGAGSTSAGSGAIALGGSYASGTDSFAAAITNNTSSYGASGANSISIGSLSKSTATRSIGLGHNITSSGGDSAVLGGQGNTASGYAGTTIGGASNIADGDYSTAKGSNGRTNGIRLKHATGLHMAMQGAYMVLGHTTSDATPKVLNTNYWTANATNQVVLPNNSAFGFTGTIVARQKASEGTASAAWKVEGLIRREGTAGTTVLVASTVTALSNAPSWGMALTADTTNGCLKIAATGAASTNIRWVATINTSEVLYA